MRSRAALITCACAFAASLVGCDGGSKKVDNPSDLPYSTDGPPRRDSLPSPGGKPIGKPKKP